MQHYPQTKRDDAKPIDRTRRLNPIICVNRGRMALSGQTEDTRSCSKSELYPESFPGAWNKARPQPAAFTLLSAVVSAFSALL